MNTKIRYIKKVPIMKVVLGFVLFCIGIHGAIFNNIFSLVLSGIGMFLMLTQGSEIDLKIKKYREISSVLGIDIGRWKPLPDIEYVSVFSTTQKSRVQGMGASATFKSNIIKLNLFYNKNKKIEAYRTVDIEEAFNVAKHLSEALNIDVLDATKKDSKWL